MTSRRQRITPDNAPRNRALLGNEGRSSSGEDWWVSLAAALGSGSTVVDPEAQTRKELAEVQCECRLSHDPPTAVNARTEDTGGPPASWAGRNGRVRPVAPGASRALPSRGVDPPGTARTRFLDAVQASITENFRDAADHHLIPNCERVPTGGSQRVPHSPARQNEFRRVGQGLLRVAATPLTSVPGGFGCHWRQLWAAARLNSPKSSAEATGIAKRGVHSHRANQEKRIEQSRGIASRPKTLEGAASGQWHPMVIWLLGAAFLFLTGSRASASDETAAASTVISAIQDDANLHDVQFVDELHGLAVGDHGVIWQTADGGRNWNLLRSPGECALRSVSFLSDQVGWIAGGTTTPYTRLGVGVLLATTDRGRTWAEISQGRMPRLRFVRFFSPSTGVLVGEASAEFPTGVMMTSDGGKTWKAVEGVRRPGWRGADFLAPEAGVTVGLDGTTSRIESKLVDLRVGGFGRAASTASNSAATTRAGWWATVDSSCGPKTGASSGKALPRHSPKRQPTSSISAPSPFTARTSGLQVLPAASSGTRPMVDSPGRRSARDKPHRSSGSISAPNGPAGPSARSARSSAPTTAGRPGKHSAAAIVVRHSCRSYRGPGKSRLPCSPSKRPNSVIGARSSYPFARPTKGRPRCRRNSTCVCTTPCWRPAGFTPRSAGNFRWMCPASTATAKSSLPNGCDGPRVACATRSTGISSAKSAPGGRA